MNIKLDFLRFIKKLPCRTGKNVKFLSSASLNNILGNIDKIKIGSHSILAGELTLFGHGGSINIGEWCYVGGGTRIWSASSISIGDRVLIAHNVNIFDSLTHPINSEDRHKHFMAIATSGHPKILDLDEDPVILEDDVWVGANSIILKGVRIGAGSIIGAGAVVTKDVPSNVIAVGNPARVVREIN